VKEEEGEQYPLKYALKGGKKLNLVPEGKK
jgi:hypothetical protein